MFGDGMKKYIMPIFLALLTGLILGRFVLNQYEFEGRIVSVAGKGTQAYFIEQGVYTSKDEMEGNTKSFPYYIYTVGKDKYHVYIGITFSDKNVSKIKGYYKNLGYDTNVREISINNNDFTTVLEQYDNLLENSSEDEVIGTVCSQVLNKYEELVLNGSKN